jgi:DNA adenine methylase
MPKTQITPRPFLKCAGGKGQLLPELLKRLPSSFDSYHEPFLGGGALFFELYRSGFLRGKQVFLSDSNAELIKAYMAVRDNVDRLVRVLRSYPHSKEHFLKLRNEDPNKLHCVESAARTIYLNRTCFNGLYRVNKSGKFNVAWGRYTNLTICDEENLFAVSEALQGVHLRCQSFEDSIRPSCISHGAFVYCDPPYVPLSVTSGFTAYTAEGFGESKQLALAEKANWCASNGVHIMLSNSATAWVWDKYSQHNVSIVKALRRINCAGTKRGAISEVIITSYKTPGSLAIP